MKQSNQLEQDVALLIVPIVKTHPFGLLHMTEDVLLKLSSASLPFPFAISVVERGLPQSIA